MNVLYISYDGALDPLGSSQIEPYLTALSKNGVKFTLLTYEKKERLKDVDSVLRMKKILEDKNIRWEILRYHKSPTVPATAFDITMGFIKVLVIVLRDKIKLIHARSFVGAIPALLIARPLKLKFIFDMRGFWADERVDGNIWDNKGLLYKISKWLEMTFILNADWVICLTEEARVITEKFLYLIKKGIFIDVIPTCVDTTKFTVRVKDRVLLTDLNLQNRIVFIYFGAVGTWYMLDEMIDFFKISKQINPASFFLVLSPKEEFVSNRIALRKINKEDYFVKQIPYKEMPSWISLADVSISFIKPAYSKKSSCPTKFAESLACGIPVVINSGIGDTDKFVNNYNIGVVVKNFQEEEYIKASKQLFRILEDTNNIKNNCRRIAEDFFSLESGVDKYRKIYQKLTCV